MAPESPIPPMEVDLLVVGGLTVDVFADGRRAAGGSPLHATLAGVAAGLRIGVVTAAGDEPEALAGLAEIGRRAVVHAERVKSSIGFRHESGPAGRRLVLTDPGAQLAAPSRAFRPRAVLYAPVAAEFGANLAGQRYEGATTGAILQGWLRPVDVAGRVGRGSLDMLDTALLHSLAHLDLLCLSVEDAVGDGVDAPASADAILDELRALVGSRPLLALTAGARGAWLDQGRTRILVPPPVVIGADGNAGGASEEAATVGAGDAYAAILLASLAAGEPPIGAATLASREVARFLRRRRRRRVVVGDVHGHRDRVLHLLREEGLVDEGGAWSGGEAELWFLGDLMDRGPDGIGVVELVMRLQAEAAVAGGRVECLLGNHEVLILAARLMPEARSGGPGRSFQGDWLANGGRESDLARLTPDVIAWLRARPAMALVDGDLLVHADNPFYAELGDSVAAVNAAVVALLAARDPGAWDRLLERFSRRLAFTEPTLLEPFLARFGAERLVHGHTPVPVFQPGEAAAARAAHRYGGGRAVAADPGLYLGGPGFVVEL